MKVLIYGRVSTISQDVTRQIEELSDYCESQNLEVVKIFTETISGTKTRKQRKEINQLLEYVSKNKEIKGILIWELSRLGRNTLDVLNTINELTSRRIWVYSKKENLYTLNQDGTEDPTTKLTLTILSGVSTLERETTVSRSISGLRKTVMDGNWVGGKFLPYGYKRQDKKLIIDEEESEVIKLIFKLYLEGNGTKKISNELNKLKISTRYNKSVSSVIINDIEKKGVDFTWKDGTVYSILTNPVYIGNKIGKGTIEGLKIFSPRIISDEDFKLVQTKLKNSTTKHKTKFFYLFDKILKCGVCGRNYHPHKRLSNKDNRYICLSKRYGESCNNYGISIPKMNDGVWSLLRHDKNELRNILKFNSTKEELEKEISDLSLEIKSLIKEKNKIERKEKQLVELLLEEQIDREIYNKKYLSLSKDKEIINKNLIETESLLKTKKKYKSKQDNLSSQLRGIKDDKRLLKRTINNIVDKIVIHPILEHNLNIKINKQDKFVYVEVFTFINDKFPLVFIISQRSNKIIFPKLGEYDTSTNKLEIGRLDKSFEGEEEEKELNIRELFHLKSLD